MIKFRTMRQDAEKRTGAVWAQKEDPRITRVGRILRKTRLDELPQLWNVLRGDMSLIGPRPERPGFYQRLERAIPYFAERTYGLRPGITGLAQVLQGYDRDIEDVRSKVSYDHAYAITLVSPKAWMAMDGEILWRTVGVMFGMRGQ
jgi:lipopolysaccharide/colanic/teichoic acid biosynthesis glycosyltransferase